MTKNIYNPNLRKAASTMNLGQPSRAQPQEQETRQRARPQRQEEFSGRLDFPFSKPEPAPFYDAANASADKDIPLRPRASHTGLPSLREQPQERSSERPVESYYGPPKSFAAQGSNVDTVRPTHPHSFFPATTFRDSVYPFQPQLGPSNGKPFDLQPSDRCFASPSPSHYSPELWQIPPQVPPKPPKIRSERKAIDYAKPFCDFLIDNPTVFHAIDAVAKDLEKHGYSKLSERDAWDLKKGGKYYIERNGSSLIAFAVGDKYEPGNGAAILAGHVDALTAKLKPIPKLDTKAGYVQLGVAPYAGALNSTWWDRDLGIGGRVLVKESSGKIVTKLVKLDWPIARIPTLAPHFGAVARGPFNPETQAVPIISLDNSDVSGYGNTSVDAASKPSVLGGEGAFTSTQPERLVKAIAGELNITDYSSIVNWELELFDTQPATLGGLGKEFIFAGRIDDKLCSWSAIQALLNSTASPSSSSSSLIKMVGLFDDEEIGSLLRQGARSNFLPQTISRILDAFAPHASPTLLGRTFASSFLVSSDVTHAVNPNFLSAYLPQHSPRLNVGLVVSADANGHMTTDAVSTAILQRCADKAGQKLQVFQIRNDVRSGGTVGPMLSAATGMRAVDAGIPQLSMHSIRATTGALDPGLGVLMFQGVLDRFEEVDREFRQ